MSTSKKWVSRRSLMTLLAIVGVIAAAGAAYADPPSDSPNTLFNLGYDPVNHILVANTSTTDAPFDCTLQDGTLTAEYDLLAEGDRIPVQSLMDELAAPVIFPSTAEPPEDPVPYPGPEGECGLSGVVVGGPEGQVNHGQVMVAFHKLFDMRGMGCLNRVVAQSDLGKGDQQINTSDVDPEFVTGATGAIDFMTAFADCEHGKSGNVGPQNAHSAGASGSHGKSGDAPGHNK